MRFAQILLLASTDGDVEARSEYPGTAQPSNEDDEEEVKTPSKKAKSEQDEYFE